MTYRKNLCYNEGTKLKGVHDMRLYLEKRTFVGEDGKPVEFDQPMLELQDGVSLPIKPVFKNDKRLLLVFADRKE